MPVMSDFLHFCILKCSLTLMVLNTSLCKGISVSFMTAITCSQCCILNGLLETGENVLQCLRAPPESRKISKLM